MEKDARSRRQRIADSYDKELERRQKLRQKYFSENQDVSDIHTNHDDGC